MSVEKEIISVIRAEQKRRASLLTNTDPDVAYYEWIWTDAPFISELCLMLLVALRHRVERRLLHFAACAADDGKEIGRQQYIERATKLRQELRAKSGWTKISSILKFESCEDAKSMEVLRLLVNAYKHEPWMEPDEALLKELRLETGANYAPLPQSPALRKALSERIGLPSDADYCDLAERFVDIADRFLIDVQRQTKLSQVKWGPLSNNPDDFAR